MYNPQICPVALSAEHRKILTQNEIVEAGAESPDVFMEDSESGRNGGENNGDIWMDIEADAGELEIEDVFVSAIKDMSS